MLQILNHLPKSMVKLHHNILPIKGQGSWIIDRMNDHYLDFTSGIGVLSTGHSHPYVVQKVQEQLPKLVHCQQQIFMSHPPQIELVQKMIDILPNTDGSSSPIDNLFFTYFP